MARDIDKIIEIVGARIPELIVVQMDKYHPADDDNFWWFRLPNQKKNIHVERGKADSTDGSCPFIVESSDDKSTDARTGNTVEEVAAMVEQYLQSLRPKN